MRMKKFSKFFMSMLAMCTIAACSNDELGNEPVVDPGASTDAVYMNVTVQLPTGPGTRSETGTTGGTGITEVGQDYENAVKSILLVLADEKNNFVAAGLGKKIEKLDDTKGIVSSTAAIEKTKLASFYENGDVKNEGKINIYVFCNPTGDLKNKLTGKSAPTGGTDWIDIVGSITESKDGVVPDAEAAVWGGQDHKAGTNADVEEGGFLMSTADEASIGKKIPSKLDYWNDYTSADKAFNFSGVNAGDNDLKKVDNKGNIKVERAVARFDFKDGSKKGNQEYPIGFDDESKATMKIKLTKMALVNMSKNFYYLRRVSDDGLMNTAGENTEICGLEYDNGTMANYVVDTDAKEKFDGITTNFEDHFNFCLGKKGDTWTIDSDARNQWRTYDIEKVLGYVEDNETWTPSDKTKEGYHIWRYVTENTIPGIDAQQHGVSTGIVFKGQILPTNNLSVPEKLKNALNEAKDGVILYAYSNKLYVTWTEVREYAKGEKAGSNLYKAAFGNLTNEIKLKDETGGPVYSNDENSADYLWSEWQKDKDNDAKLSAFKKAATGALFTLYQPSEETTENGDGTQTTKRGYFCYYYWNRHNDNGKPGVMGEMEFAVVRNNVYKLAVTKIEHLGHPRLSENDPDPEKPDKPDESDNVYLRLSVEVLPWVVRENNIEF